MRYIILMTLIAFLLFSCGGRKGGSKVAVNGSDSSTIQTEQSDNSSANSPKKTKQYSYRVVKTLPHDIEAYTQGLFWHDGFLYESTGQRGMSELRKTNPATGEVLQRVKLDNIYFGEGAALLGGKIYQLTWEEGRAFVYDLATLRQIGSFSYDYEGWGLTTDGEKLYMSDGTSVISVRNPASFAVEREIAVKYRNNRVSSINELEWINGEIWANIYGEERVIIIDPSNGNVMGIIDFAGIQAKSDKFNYPDVFNGIAYDSATGNIYVTGKLWNKIYQIEIIEKQ